MDRIPMEKLSALNKLAVRKPQQALVLLQEYEGRFRRDPSLRFDSGGILIDIGVGLNRRSLRPPLDTVPVDEKTSYMDNLDFAVYRTRVASLIYHADFIEQTIALLQLVRAAIIYLIAFIDHEERRKRGASSSSLASLTVSEYNAAPFAPALDGWIGQVLFP